MRARTVLLLAVTLLVLALLAPGGAASATLLDTTSDSLGDPLGLEAEEPATLEWADLLPGFTSGHVPSDANECKKGHINCVRAVIREMARRFDKLGCDHKALFALAYLRTTEEYERTVTADPDFFIDTPFVNHWDAVFARYYFDAYDDWAKGRVDQVPPAWQIAFSAADARSVRTAGNVLLGISAHINRDMPFTLAEIGLNFPDGTSRKPDSDKVNEFLNRVTIPLREEITARFDPAYSDSDLPGTLDETATFQMVVAWREAAWRNAERLVSAQTEQERAQVAAEIEAASAAINQSIVIATAYGPGETSASRDVYCLANR